MADDSEISRRVRDLIEQHHMSVGWYSQGFDIPFLNTRLVQNGHRRMKTMLHLDPRWKMSGWRGLSPRNAKLAVAAEFFGLKESKMDVGVEVWARAATGNREAMDILAERCESDVRLLYDVTQRILDSGFIKTIPSYP